MTKILDKYLFCFILLVTVSRISAQNLVPNPSFESYGTLPCSWITSSANFNAAINNWTMPTSGSTDIFSTLVATTCYAHCLSTHSSSPGNELPRTGDVMSAIVAYGAGCGSQPNYREYLEIQLTSPMIIGETYDVEFYVSLGENCSKATNNVGVHFSTSYISGTNCFTLNNVPQINITSIITQTSGWYQVAGTVVATQAWEYMTIGNFFSNAATSTQAMPGSQTNTRIFVDDVSVQPLVVLGVDFLAFEVSTKDRTAILDWEVEGQQQTDFYTIERSKDGINWAAIADIEKHGVNNYRYIDANPFIGVSYYRIKEYNNSGEFSYSDIRSVELEAQGGFVNIYPNPTKDLINIELSDMNDAVQFVLIDQLGRTMEVPVQKNNRGAQLNLSSLPSGTYYLRVFSENLYKTEKIVLRP